MTLSYMLFLADWARSLAWMEVATRFHTGWKQVYTAVRYVVEWGLEHRDLSGVKAIGVDEIQYGHGQSYLTLVYQLCGPNRRLLYMARTRTEKALREFFDEQGHIWCNGIDFVSSDMWKPYLNVISTSLKNAVHILDRYHIVAKLNEAIDMVRRQESRHLRENGYVNHLVKAKYCFLKNPENLTDKQELRLSDVLQYDLKSVRAYLLKESFQCFWTYKSPYWADWFLRKWCTRAMRSQLAPIKKFVKTVRSHHNLILNWFKAKKQFSSGAVEGMNRKFNLVTRKSYGFRTYDVLKIAMFHTLGLLPEPARTHRY
jgi:transposase